MINVKDYISNNKKSLIIGASASFAVASAIGSVNYVGPNEFGVQEILMNVTDANVKSGVHFQIPFVQITHKYNTAIQKFTFNAGSGRWIKWAGSTEDRNTLTAKVKLSYKIDPDETKIIYHRWGMRKWFGQDNGYFVLTDLLNDSANAVMGKKPLGEIVADPSTFNKELLNDFRFRVETNNIPITIESIELQSLDTTMKPTHTISYQLNNP